MKIDHVTFFLRVHKVSIETEIDVEEIGYGIKLYRVPTFNIVRDGERSREIRPGSIISVFSKAGKVAQVYDLSTAIRAFRDHIPKSAQTDWEWVEAWVPKLTHAQVILDSWSKGGREHQDEVHRILSEFVSDTAKMNSKGKKEARDLVRKFENLRDKLDRVNPPAAATVVATAIRRLRVHRVKIGKTGVRAERCYYSLVEIRAQYSESLEHIRSESKYIGSNPTAAMRAFDRIDRELATLKIAPYLRPAQEAHKMLDQAKKVYREVGWKPARDIMHDVMFPFSVEKTLTEITELSHRLPAKDDLIGLEKFAELLVKYQKRLEPVTKLQTSNYQCLASAVCVLLGEVTNALSEGQWYLTRRKLEAVDIRIRFEPRG